MVQLRVFSFIFGTIAGDCALHSCFAFGAGGGQRGFLAQRGGGGGAGAGAFTGGGGAVITAIKSVGCDKGGSPPDAMFAKAISPICNRQPGFCYTTIFCKHYLRDILPSG